MLLLLLAEELPLVLLGEDVECAGGDVEGTDAREENGEEDESLETGLQPSMLYWLTEELL